MSRLLFAAARGARIEVRAFNERHWYQAYSIDTHTGSAAADLVYRIHPDDEHLQYGPISSALREAAERPYPVIGAYGPTYSYAVSGAITDGVGWANTFYFSHPKEGCDKTLHRSLFLLLLAEALVDEGL